MCGAEVIVPLEQYVHHVFGLELTDQARLTRQWVLPVSVALELGLQLCTSTPDSFTELYLQLLYDSLNSLDQIPKEFFHM